ncbi:DUF4244 domain-containing protein [Arthrobacter sp. 7Tela_A1]|uniref:DUF4244 domain-containing protein n=1 Tax=Arthrobacter sp. 7Tela_A1 TaxID=3093745 RepID=UPI003BB4B631
MHAAVKFAPQSTAPVLRRAALPEAAPGHDAQVANPFPLREPEPDHGRPPATVTDIRTKRRQLPAVHEPEAGMATAEYAIATLAAVAFAALLAAVLGSGDVRELLMSLIRAALSFG